LSPSAIDERDARAIERLSGVAGVFANPTGWYQNASFLLPLIATVAVALLAAFRRSGELAGFAAFLAAVTLLMLPIVLAGWRQTATAVVVTEKEIVSFHHGRLLKRLEWAHVRQIQGRETQGNRRWEIATDGGERLLLDGEIEELPQLIALARSLAGFVAPDSSGT
jgi:hypothetical protein